MTLDQIKLLESRIQSQCPVRRINKVEVQTETPHILWSRDEEREWKKASQKAKKGSRKRQKRSGSTKTDGR